MALQRWYPMTETRRKDGAVDRMWRGFNGWGYIFGAPAQRAVALDIVDEGETVVVRASLPGISPEDIQVTIEDDVLTLKGEASEEGEDDGEHYLLRERRYGGFHRAIRLPDTVDNENAETAYENGVLTVKFPKQEAKKARQLEVKVS